MVLVTLVWTLHVVMAVVACSVVNSYCLSEHVRCWVHQRLSASVLKPWHDKWHISMAAYVDWPPSEWSSQNTSDTPPDVHRGTFALWPWRWYRWRTGQRIKHNISLQFLNIRKICSNLFIWRRCHFGFIFLFQFDQQLFLEKKTRNNQWWITAIYRQINQNLVKLIR